MFMSTTSGLVFTDTKVNKLTSTVNSSIGESLYRNISNYEHAEEIAP